MDGAELEQLRDELSRLRRAHAELKADHHNLAQSSAGLRKALLATADAAGDLGELRQQVTALVTSSMDPASIARIDAARLVAQKLESLGRLVGGIAHDFNNSLTVITNYVTLALPSVSGETRTDLEHSLSAAERAATLTAQLSAFARKQTISPRAVNLNDLLKRVSGLLRRLLGEDIEVCSIFDPDLWEVVVDPGQFEQVVLKLAANARDAMPRGGRLTLATKNRTFEREGPTDLPRALRADCVCFSVSDVGPCDAGTSPDVELALAAVQNIADDNGGGVQLQHDADGRTTCHVYLPRARQTRAAPTRDQRPTPNGHETILLVEDDPLIRRLAAHVLQGHGYVVLQAESSSLALELAQTHRGPLHLLLSDVVLPRMNGRALADQLLQARPELKVLYVSGSVDQAVRHHGVLTPGVAFLEKPYTPATLARKVRDVLDV